MHLKLPLTLTVCAALMAVVVIWRSNKAVQWAEEPLLLQFQIFGLDVTMMAARAVSWVTGREYLSTVRSVISCVHRSRDFNSPTMKVSHAQMDGVAAQVFYPQPSPVQSPAIIYLHGGGWSILDVEIYEETCHYIAAQFNVVVILIDYRQSPEHPYPVPFEDCLKAVLHILRNAQTLGLDPDRIAIAGDSAGGNLAAAVALRLSQPDMVGTFPPLKFQVLIYPVLQMVDLNTQSYTNFSTTGFITKHFMTQLWLSYLGYPELYQHQAEFEANSHSFELLKDPQIASLFSPEHLPQELRLPGFEPVRPDSGNRSLAAKVQARLVDPYFAPLMAEDVSGVPHAYFIMANIDILRDDGFLYAQRLQRSGVKTEVDFYPAMSHGFMIVHSPRSLMFQRTIQAFDNLGKFAKEYL